MKKVDFFFDLSSPYSYLAATQLPALCRRVGAELSYRPMVLGAVFKSVGNDMPARVPNKARWMLHDLSRWAEQYGVPFRMSSHFPVNCIKAMRLILVDPRKSDVVTEAAFKAMWVDDRNLADDAEVGALADAFEIDRAAIEQPPIKERLRANTDEAIGRGAFGAPTMFVGDELFWGNDRLQFVESALRRG
jgi:2-hydroxychromene-2-carboxylate isomerase